MYPGLNAFRAFAFFAVFLFHTYKLHAGYLGVNAFFVLSGFLLTPILLDMKGQFDGKAFFARFYGRRALRIFPLYYVYLAAVTALCLVALQWDEFPERYNLVRFIDQIPVATLFLVDFAHAMDEYESTKLLSHFWSLAVEEQFYLLWPLVIFLVPGKTLKPLLLIIIACGPLTRWFIGSDFLFGAMPFLDRDVDARVYFLPFSHLDGFALGGYFALYRKSGTGLSVWLLFALAYGLGVSSQWLTEGTFKASELGYGPFMPDSAKHIWGFSLLNLAFANTILHVRDRKFLPFLFENRLLDYFGKISYGLYVYHFGAILVIYGFLRDQPEPLRIVLALALTMAVSVASYELMEKRFLVYKDRLFSRDRDGDKRTELKIAASPAK